MSAAPGFRSIVLAALPAAAAILVFGLLYGAAARPLLGPGVTVLLSLIVFSGALQFALVGLLAAGAGPAALLLTAVTLNLRFLVLGAVMRPMLGGSRLRRAGLAALMVDETFGVAVAAGAATGISGADRSKVTERVLAVTGAVCYTSWIAGTVLGVLGAAVPGVEGAAAAVFPVLFIGLAALAARSGTIVARAAAAVAITVAIAVAMPDARALAPVIAGVLVCLPGRSTSGLLAGRAGTAEP